MRVRLVSKEPWSIAWPALRPVRSSTSPGPPRPPAFADGDVGVGVTEAVHATVLAPPGSSAASPVHHCPRTEVRKQTLVVALTHEGITGLGEAVPTDYYGQTLDSASGRCRRWGRCWGGPA